MTHLFNIFFILITYVFLICSAQDSGKVCKTDCCPQPAGQSSSCPGFCTTDDTSDCSLFYLRAKNGSCITGRDCPVIPCGENEHFNDCPVGSEDCDNVTSDGGPPIIIGNIGTTVICKPACRCNEYYWRNKNKECVCYTECPKFQNEG